MQRKSITCRFRKRMDSDLMEATSKMTSGELSEAVRNGLRLMLGIRTVRQMEVKEVPIQLPREREKAAAPLSTTAKVFRPNSHEGKGNER